MSETPVRRLRDRKCRWLPHVWVEWSSFRSFYSLGILARGLIFSYRCKDVKYTDSYTVRPKVCGHRDRHTYTRLFRKSWTHTVVQNVSVRRSVTVSLSPELRRTKPAAVRAQSELHEERGRTSTCPARNRATVFQIFPFT